MTRIQNVLCTYFTRFSNVLLLARFRTKRNPVVLDIKEKIEDDKIKK